MVEQDMATMSIPTPRWVKIDQIAVQCVSASSTTSCVTPNNPIALLLERATRSINHELLPIPIIRLSKISCSTDTTEILITDQNSFLEEFNKFLSSFKLVHDDKLAILLDSYYYFAPNDHNEVDEIIGTKIGMV
jgi:hypothetical protein